MPGPGTPGTPREPADPFPQDLARYLAASTGLPQPTVVRVIADVATYYSETVEEFVNSLERPRRIIVMVQAGAGTDAAHASAAEGYGFTPKTRAGGPVAEDS